MGGDAGVPWDLVTMGCRIPAQILQPWHGARGTVAGLRRKFSRFGRLGGAFFRENAPFENSCHWPGPWLQDSEKNDRGGCFLEKTTNSKKFIRVLPNRNHSCRISEPRFGSMFLCGKNPPGKFLRGPATVPRAPWSGLQSQILQPWTGLGRMCPGGVFARRGATRKSRAPGWRPAVEWW